MRAKGFTVIELVMVILLAGILSILVASDINSSLWTSRLEAARFKLKSDMIYAQNLAVTQAVKHGVIIDVSNDSYLLYRQDPSNIIDHPLDLMPFIESFAGDPSFAGVDIVSAGFGPSLGNRVEFDMLGTPSDGAGNLTSNGSVVLNCRGMTAVINVTNSTGWVQ